ncbi:histone-lysine N-methyltransferase PRDM16-like isoform X2 [Eriocheir sinensis]|uniref:histone-lysine N-methyltransferase PRDM16-like isoform X2 n=1 Tax=Eriocheir sinensis TaxID=95602 RepID=UPI0021C5FF72|nr:histone-lysine N-methyltransferase PRDM16-like isoform X2 [Eriocheir sinensis]
MRVKPVARRLPRVPGEEGDRSFRDLCDLSEADSEGGSVSPRGLLSSPHAPHGSPTPTTTPDAHDLNMKAAGAAAELSAAAQRFITQQLSSVPSELELRPSSAGVGVGVWPKQGLARGTRYGPFLGKWTANAKDPSLAWEVVSARSGLRGWLDAGEMGNWLRHIRVASAPVYGNMRHLMLAGQIFYETLRDVPPTEELLLVRKSIIDLDTPFLEDPERVRVRAGSPEERSEHTGEEEEDDDDEDDIARHRCLNCDKNFGDYDELDDHLVTAHGYAAGQYRCDYCQRAFAWRPNLIQHKTIHGEFKRYPCENCPRVFTDAMMLQKHIRHQHAGARSHACPECGKTFATSSGLKQHTHIHSSVKPFQCEVCFKAYTQFSNLCRHKRMHADCRLQIKCTKCGQAFSTVTSLAKHKRFCDTAPSLSLPHGAAGLQDSKMAHHGLHMGNLSASPPNPFMMYPRPPLPLLPPSLMSGYPMLPSIPSLVGGPQHPLLTSSLLLPFHNHGAREPSFAAPKEEKDSSEALGGPMSPRPDAESPGREAERLTPLPRSPSRSPNQASVFSMKESPRRSDSKDLSDEQRDSPDLRRRSPEPVKKEDAEAVKGPTEKKEQPLDLTLRRKEGERDELFLGRFDILSHNSDAVEERLRSPAPPEIIKSVPEPRPRPDHPFLRISELLKDTTTTNVTPAPPQPPTLLDAPTKLPLAYPRPLHPAALLDVYRNLDRSLDRSPLLPGGGLTGGRYPLLPPYFPPTSMAGLGLGLNRSAGLDMLKAHMSNTARPYGDISRPYDLMASHMPRAKDRYSCKFCGKVFPRSANLTRHLRTHTGEQPYKCKYCERSFSISSNLQRHVRNIHNKEKPFKCPLCDRCFGQQTNLDRHLKKHELEGPNPPDSPEAPDSSSAGIDTSTNFFSDEIRSFVDKVTDSTTDDILGDDEAMDDDDGLKDPATVTTSSDTTSAAAESTMKRVRVE